MYKSIVDFYNYYDNREYNNFINEFVKNNDINSIMEFGCNKMNTKYSLNNKIKYLGINRYEDIINYNSKYNKSENKIYICKKISEYENLPDVDLFIINREFEYESHKNIKNILENIAKKKFKYLIINYSQIKFLNNVDLPNKFMPIDFNKTPFNFDIDINYSYYNKIYLIKYLSSIVILFILSIKKKYKLYIFSLLFTIIYGMIFLQKQNIIVLNSKKLQLLINKINFK